VVHELAIAAAELIVVVVGCDAMQYIGDVEPGASECAVSEMRLLSLVAVLLLVADLSGKYEYPAVIQSRFDPRLAHTCYTHTMNGTRVMAYAKLQF
jgi:hypothetical protein